MVKFLFHFSLYDGSKLEILIIHMKIASRGEDRECRVLEDHSPRSLWIVEDLKNVETTSFKAAASQLQESCSRFIKLHTSA